MDKLYVVTRADLPFGVQAVQSMHAAIEFAMEHREMTARWFVDSNYLALLSVPNEAALEALLEKARKGGLASAFFREPALNNELTAIALEPGHRSKRACFGLPLALGAMLP